jgi:hypothetical protein
MRDSIIVRGALCEGFSNRATTTFPSGSISVHSWVLRSAMAYPWAIAKNPWNALLRVLYKEGQLTDFDDPSA